MIACLNYLALPLVNQQSQPSHNQANAPAVISLKVREVFKTLKVAC